MNFCPLLKSTFCLIACLSIVGCSTNQKYSGAYEEPIFSYERIVMNDAETPFEIWDPLESTNRSNYHFNANFDKYVYLPALNGYQSITPDVIEKGISNVFYNLDNIRTLINQILQIKPKQSFETLSRLFVNSTAGILGIFDVATYLDMPRHDEDFGQTLGYYGVVSGAYSVIPIIGPSSTRDGFGKLLDTLFVTPLFLDGKPDRQMVVYPLRFLDERAKTSFRYYETGSPFEYELVRLLYMTKRDLEIRK